jgi:internalin A
MKKRTVVEFKGKAFTDDRLKSIPGLVQLRRLSLWDTSVTDDGIAALACTESLVEISISSDRITGKSVQILSELPSLRSLLIHRGPRVGDEALVKLSKCGELRELYLSETLVTDRGLSDIGSFPYLWSLDLSGTAISDEGCAALKGMPQLGLLNLSRSRVTGIGLAGLHDNEHFSIILEGTPATDGSVEAIAEWFSNLQLISLNDTRVGDRAARALSRLQRLYDARLSGTDVTDDGITAFIGHPSLEALYIERCSISPEAVQALKKARRRLTIYGP